MRVRRMVLVQAWILHKAHHYSLSLGQLANIQLRSGKLPFWNPGERILPACAEMGRYKLFSPTWIHVARNILHSSPAGDRYLYSVPNSAGVHRGARESAASSRGCPRTTTACISQSSSVCTTGRIYYASFVPAHRQRPDTSRPPGKLCTRSPPGGNYNYS